ncbi:MAG: cytochrome C [Spirochaetae bacterium HGW-Spirochaetae-1]|jgi:thiosulfate dehydrogenase|nr:MAG: cytochrome C [Spirochaetae bacterium HGW-Spirochaetae-1]
MIRKTTTLFFIFSLIAGFLYADTFTKKDVERWKNEFDAAARYGRQLFEDSAEYKLGTNKVACAQCHPNAANTHPETYPKFQKQLGKVISLAEMVNWCIINPLEGKPLKLDSKEMVALLAYICSERKGVKMDPGKH